jgi:hypothetical protein
MKMTRTRVAIASVLAVAGFAAATADALTLPKWWHSDAVPRRRAASRSVRSWRLCPDQQLLSATTSGW